MPHSAVVMFTAQAARGYLQDGAPATGGWMRTRTPGEYLVCTQNRHNSGLSAHRPRHMAAAFLIGRIAGCGAVPEDPGRWLIKISEYIIPMHRSRTSGENPATCATRSGTPPSRNSASTSTVLPPFQPSRRLRTRPTWIVRQLAAPLALIAAGQGRAHPPRLPRKPTPAPTVATPGARLDAILAQLDRRPRPARADRPARLGRTWPAAMIAVDTSAIVAIVLGEPERAAFRQAIMQAGKALISTASVLEVKMVLYGRRGPRGVVLVDDMLRLPISRSRRRARRTWMPRSVPSSCSARAAAIRRR